MTATNAHVTEATASTEAAMRPQRVPVNVYEASGALIVVAPLPAVQAQDVCVEVHPGSPPTMRFWAHVRSSGTRDYLVHEWEYGGYERELPLPDGFGGDVEATLRNGQLVVRVLRGECGADRSVTPSATTA
jgi:HSP20 family molecular chaperone IbpA